MVSYTHPNMQVRTFIIKFPSKYVDCADKLTQKGGRKLNFAKIPGIGREMHYWLFRKSKRGKIITLDGKHASEKFFKMLDGTGRPSAPPQLYTYCLNIDGTLYISETSPSFRKQQASKHVALCGWRHGKKMHFSKKSMGYFPWLTRSKHFICAAGEALVGYNPFTKQHEFLIDNAAGSYKPSWRNVRQVLKLLQRIPGLTVIGGDKSKGTEVLNLARMRYDPKRVPFERRSTQEKAHRTRSDLAEPNTKRESSEQVLPAPRQPLNIHGILA